MFKKISVIVLATSLLTSNAHAILSPNSNIRQVLKTVGALGLAFASADYFLESLGYGKKFINNSNTTIYLKNSAYYMCLAILASFSAHTMYESSRARVHWFFR